MQTSRSTFLLTSCFIYVAFADRGELAAPSFSWEPNTVHKLCAHACHAACVAFKHFAPATIPMTLNMARAGTKYWMSRYYM
eukprot:1989058-Amphidinium_carterae.1